MDTDTLIDLVRQGGIVGALALLLLALFKKWLIIGSWYADTTAICDKRLAEKEAECKAWKGAFEASDATCRAQVEQLNVLPALIGEIKAMHDKRGAA